MTTSIAFFCDVDVGVAQQLAEQLDVDGPSRRASALSTAWRMSLFGSRSCACSAVRTLPAC